jgi:ERCC4-related helicase
VKEEVLANKEGTSKSKKSLTGMPQFHNLMLMLEEFADNGGYNHPKMQKVQELVIQHFRTPSRLSTLCASISSFIRTRLTSVSGLHWLLGI